MKYFNLKLWLVIFFAMMIILTNLGIVPLLDPDEPVYGQTAKEMIGSGDYISPRIYGEYWFDKPPMYYWLVAVAYKIFGVSEFATRLPSAVLGIAGAVLVYFFARKLFGDRAGFSAALILITSLEYVYLSKAAVTDITLCFFLTGALLSFLDKRYYLFYIFAALAVVTKGPVGIGLPAIIIGLYIIVTRQFELLRQMKIFSGGLLFLAVALPWYLIMYEVHGQIFVDTFLGFHNVTRFTTPEHPTRADWYFFIPVVIIGFFPWICILAQAVWGSLTESSVKDRNNLIFLNIWAGFVLLFFSFSQTKLVSYILPMWPPMAIITGWYIGERWKNYQERHLASGATLLLLTGGLTAAFWYGAKAMPELILGVVALSAVLAVSAGASLVLFLKRQISSVFWTQFAAGMIFIAVLINMMLPLAAPKFTSKYLTEEFLKAYDQTSPVNILKFLRPGFAFYSDIYGREIHKDDELTDAVQKYGSGYYIVRQKDFQELPGEMKKAFTLIAQEEGVLILRKS